MARRPCALISLFWLLVCLCGTSAASELHGQVTFGGLPMPGATITVIQGTTKTTTVSDSGGIFSVANLSDGPASIEIEMQCFSTVHDKVKVSARTPSKKWELMLLPLEQLIASSKLQLSVESAREGLDSPQRKEDSSLPESPNTQDDVAEQQASDGFLINGSVNNAATSQYSLDPAFGNRRPGSKSIYTGSLAAVLGNSAFDARPYSLSGVQTPKPKYDHVTGALTFGGPLKIPHLLHHGPNIYIGYQWTRNDNASTLSGLVPTAAERTGDLSGLLNSLGQPITIYNPATGRPFAGNIVPVSSQAQELLRLYPLPNLADDLRYNYQTTVLNSLHQDVFESRIDKTLNRRDQIYGAFSVQGSRNTSSNLFGFVDKSDTLDTTAQITWSHRVNRRLFLVGGYRFSRLRTHVMPYFENRQNVSGLAGIVGSSQDPANWGPPTLNFSSGIASLTDVQSSFNRDRTDTFSGSATIYSRRHNVTVGIGARKQQFNYFFQEDPRGTFTFTGAATQVAGTNPLNSGSDFADFLLGVPDASSIGFGNADKYLRQSVYDAYVSDDWRILPILTINGGLRWEYGAPITEAHGRLVNLDVAFGFTAAAPVVGSDPVGLVTGNRYPSSLVHPDKLGFEPRIGVSWRPIPASTIVVRAGYGIYHDTSVYLKSALQMAQQAPLSKSLTVPNSTECPLTIANGFSCPATTSGTFAVDRNFRVGYAQTWQLSVQRDLPAALQLTATYQGVKGTRGVQQFLPNTYPIGAETPCPTCPSGFIYQTSGGNSTRQSGQLQLRRRLRSGFTASLLYTYSKSIDNDALVGGQGYVSATQSQSATQAPIAIAQDWRNLRAERARSSFDQRHLLNVQAQYTSGQGLGAGTLMQGWRGKLLKEWTVVTQVVAGSGLPQTPIYMAAIPGAGFIGIIRPSLTGAPIYAASSSGLHLNPAAYTAPFSGQWGNAGRNSISGPSQLSLDTSFARTFRPSARYYLDARIDIVNLLNHAVFTNWNTTVNSAQFGLPLAANAMRNMNITLRAKF